MPPSTPFPTPPPPTPPPPPQKKKNKTKTKKQSLWLANDCVLQGEANKLINSLCYSRVTREFK